MITIHLIRHGKASPGEAEYDQLHERGVRQAHLLGVHLGARATRFDAVYCGPLVRQRETWRLMREAAGAAGRSWSEAVILDGLREAPVEMIMRQCMVERLATDAALQALIARVQTAGDDRPALRVAMSAVFDHMVGLWRHGRLARDGLEPHAAFRARVLAAWDVILAEATHDRDVAVVTSNGVIGCLVEHIESGVDGAAPTPTPRAELQFANASITRITARGGALEVAARNVHDHIDDEKLVTYL